MHDVQEYKFSTTMNIKKCHVFTISLTSQTVALGSALLLWVAVVALVVSVVSVVSVVCSLWFVVALTWVDWIV